VPGFSGAFAQEEIVLSERTDAVLRTAPPTGPALAGSDRAEGKALLSLILTSLEDDKAEDVVTIDLAGKSEMADYMVIASGRSSRQVGAISEKLSDRLKHEAGVICRLEGKDAGDWVLIDCGDVVVHVFRPEVRDFYQLEKMWLSANGKPEARPRTDA
jgi:ribosome-associated protein